MGADRNIIAIEWTKDGDKQLIRDALKSYIVKQTDVLKNHCLSEQYPDWDEKVAQSIERAIELYKGVTEYTSTAKIDDNSAVIRKKI